MFFVTSRTYYFLKTSVKPLRQGHIWRGCQDLEITIRIANSIDSRNGLKTQQPATVRCDSYPNIDGDSDANVAAVAPEALESSCRGFHRGATIDFPQMFHRFSIDSWGYSVLMHISGVVSNFEAPTPMVLDNLDIETGMAMNHWGQHGKPLPHV